MCLNFKITNILIGLLFSFIVKAQNLVPNPSFEQYSICPDHAGQINATSGWTSYNYGTPDYFNSCSVFCNPGCVGIPNNTFGYQLAIDNAYIGIVNHSLGYREIFGIQLTDSLIIGTKYYVSAYASRAYTTIYFYTGASNNIGFKFSTIPYDSINQIAIDNFAHVNEINIIMDTINWTKISGSFIADSAYKFLAIGNFFDYMHTSTFPSGGFEEAYYYIDYICVSPDSMECAQNFVGLSKIEKAEMKIYPNPFWEVINVKTESSEIDELSLYDVLSRKILFQKFSGDASISTAHLENGVYMYKLIDSKGFIHTGKIVKE